MVEVQVVVVCKVVLDCIVVVVELRIEPVVEVIVLVVVEVIVLVVVVIKIVVVLVVGGGEFAS